MRRLRSAAVLTLFMGILAAPGCGERDLSKPPEIRYGHDVCQECRMIIGDGRFAAAAAADGRFLKFDDVGCMALHEKKRSEPYLRSWVREEGGDLWIGTGEAYFVHSADLVTPMGYGFAAFKDADAASQFVQAKGGRRILWKDLSALTDKR